MSHNSKQWLLLLGGSVAQSVVLSFVHAPLWVVAIFSVGWGIVCGVLFARGFLDD